MNRVPIPKRMSALGRDSRGYPIPYNVLRNLDGRPHFTISDHRRQARALKEHRCGICGTRMKKPFWFVGGPGSAFHPEGAYVDPPMHHECMTYAMQVCPYLALPHYLGRIDTATVDPSRLDVLPIFFDPTMIPERPALFVCVAANGYEVRPRELASATVRPARPYTSVEYWQFGKRLGPDAAKLAFDIYMTKTWKTAP
jgi:hypothetical protein